MSHPGGRPLKYKTPKALQTAIDNYFATHTKVSIVELALDLGFDSRKSFYNYNDTDRPQFLHIIKNAQARVEAWYEKLGQDSRNGFPIFALKNMGWSDKHEVEQTTHLDGVIRLPSKKDIGDAVDPV
jgi:hypothetical protein